MEEILGIVSGLVIVLGMKVFILEIRVDRLGDLKKKVDDLHKTKFY